MMPVDTLGKDIWRSTLSMSLAISTEMTEAAQPMPDRFTVRMLDLNLKCRTTAAEREGVGLKAVQLMISPSICTAHQDCLATLSALKDQSIHNGAFEVQHTCCLMYGVLSSESH